MADASVEIFKSRRVIALAGDAAEPGAFAVLGERIFDAITNAYGRTLAVALRHPAIVMIIFLGTFAVNVQLFNIVPKGFFPQQDNGRLAANIVGQQDVSFATIQEKMIRYANILKDDPAIDTVTLFTGGGGGRGAFVKRHCTACRDLSRRG